LKESASVWRSVTADWSFRADELERLRLACEMLDAADDARLTVEREGAVTPDRFGQPKRHPAMVIQRDAAVAAARLLAGLGIAEPEAKWPRRRGGMNR
jgi:hypothetical protein